MEITLKQFNYLIQLLFFDLYIIPSLIKMQKNNETSPPIRLIGFKSLRQPIQSQSYASSIHSRKYLFNIAIIEYGASPEQKAKLKQVQLWARQRRQEIRLWKITKQAAFAQTYRQMIATPLKTYFVTSLTIEQIAAEPLQDYYKQLEPEKYTLEDFNKQAQKNLQKIVFIIVKKDLHRIDRKNYFHINVALITYNIEVVKDLLDQKLTQQKLKIYESQSEVNSQMARRWQQAVEMPTKVIQVKEQRNQENQSQQQLSIVKLINDTPGVGTYHISKSR